MRQLASSEFSFRPAFALFFSATAFTLLTAATASALSLKYEVFDKGDLIPGEDLWGARITLSGDTFDPDDGFTIYFDSAQYSTISLQPPTPPDWDLLVIQSDPVLSAPALFDGLSLVNGAPLSDPFLLDFVWIGAGAPRSVDWERYTLNGGFEVLESGTATVPEAHVGWISGVMLTAAVAVSHRRRRL